MTKTRLTIWCNPQVSDSARALLTEGTKAHRVVFSPVVTYNLDAGPADPALLKADVAFGQPDPQTIIRAEKLRWTHLTSAGYARYDTPEFRNAIAARGAILTNSSQVYAEPCAEHLFAFMLVQARQLLWTYQMQLTERSWKTEPLRVASRLLTGQSMLLLGYGAIARRLCKLVEPFGIKITAVRRHPTGDERVPTIREDQIEQALREADHVVNTLPEGEATKHFVNAARFAAMKPGAIFYNVGRGGTVDQDALLASLRSDQLGAAYLDVTVPEPLPPEHPLWSAPRCYITPHAAGGHSDEHERFVRHFLENVKRFTTGKPLLDRVM
ncbi:MAG TPA: D-2-hydroxyacid dehydrogenase [Chthoniobacterales bacterium]|nr:D-2-hydroxyacid dehydrogenase [Chthoniobacterales bacterium]